MRPPSARWVDVSGSCDGGTLQDPRLRGDDVLLRGDDVLFLGDDFFFLGMTFYRGDDLLQPSKVTMRWLIFSAQILGPVPMPLGWKVDIDPVSLL